MTDLTLTVNGRAVSASVEPRTHLADFLREALLLTGTHLGCEHGVCGACTVLLDGEPVRGCITFAALCQGRAVQSIEGLADDPVMAALRAAFTAEHALQCGYCTPGMLITARDIVRRLPDADDDRVRLELAGNLCRCTGYNGIVRAIRQVLDDPPAVAAIAPAAVPRGSFAASAAPAPLASASPPDGHGLAEILHLAVPVERVWAAVQDPALIAGCVPGVQVSEAAPDRIVGVLQAALGPIRARFAGEATVTFDAATHSGRIVGQGQDALSHTRLSAWADFTVAAEGSGSTIRLDVTYTLQGRLAQFGRGPVVRVFATELAAAVATNLEARLRGQAAPAAAPLRPARLLWRALLRLLRWHR